MKSAEVAVVITASLVIAMSEQLSSSTVRLMVTKKGFDYLNDIGPEFVMKFIQSKVRGKKMTSMFRSITMENFNIKNFSIFPSPQNGLNIVLTNVSLSISALVVILGNDIPLTFSTNGLTTHWAATVSPGQQGQPVFNITYCKFDPGNYCLNFKKSKLVSFIIDYLLKTLFDWNTIVCEILVSDVQHLFNSIFPSPPVYKIIEFAAINFALFGPVNFTEDYMVSEHKGYLVTANIPNKILRPQKNVSLPPFQPGSCLEKMICMWATEYVANTISMVFKRTGNMIFNITEDTIEDDTDHDLTSKIKEQFFKLDTSTFSLIVPQLFYRYGSQNLMLTVRAVKNIPTVTVSKEQAMFNIPAAIDVYVNDTNQHVLPLAFTMNMSSFVNATIHIQNGTNSTIFTLTANVTGVNITVGHNRSNIGQIDYTKINKLIRAFKLIHDHLLPHLKKKIKEGYEVKSIYGLRFIDPEITHFDGSLLLGTDFSYEVH